MSISVELNMVRIRVENTRDWRTSIIRFFTYATSSKKIAIIKIILKYIEVFTAPRQCINIHTQMKYVII